jgi:hypothetical protein
MRYCGTHAARFIGQSISHPGLVKTPSIEVETPSIGVEVKQPFRATIPEATRDRLTHSVGRTVGAMATRKLYEAMQWPAKRAAGVRLV